MLIVDCLFVLGETEHAIALTVDNFSSESAPISILFRLAEPTQENVQNFSITGQSMESSVSFADTCIYVKIKTNYHLWFMIYEL